MEAKFFIKGPKKSNQSSNLTSQRMVTESRFMTLLLAQLIMCRTNVLAQLVKRRACVSSIG